MKNVMQYLSFGASVGGVSAFILSGILDFQESAEGFQHFSLTTWICLGVAVVGTLTFWWAAGEGVKNKKVGKLALAELAVILSVAGIGEFGPVVSGGIAAGIAAAFFLHSFQAANSTLQQPPGTPPTQQPLGDQTTQGVQP